MKLVARYFSFEGVDNRWDRMANVLRRSCDACGVEHDVRLMPVPQRTRGSAVVANHAKLKEWRDAVLEATGPIILADVDMFMQRDPRAGFDCVEHVGITYRDQGGTHIPINAGVVFVHPTKRARQFMRDWCDMDDLLYSEGVEFCKWRAKYQGMNQASLGALIETGGFQPTRLDCSKWNLVEPWDSIDAAHMVHVKGNAFRHIFNGEKSKYDSVIEIKKRWESIEHDIA